MVNIRLYNICASILNYKEDADLSSNNSGNRNLVPEAKKGLNSLRNEIASSFGLQDYENTDKGNLTSKQNGSVGGEMVKRMVEQYERGL